jgi:outer membrane immunogenic protein
MNKVILGTVAAAALAAASQAAFAADVNAPAFLSTQPPTFSWARLYIGADAGYGWATAPGLDAQGGVGGVQIGYNFQTGNFVFGIEGDGALADISQTLSGVAFGVPLSATFTNDTLVSLRGRFGLALSNVLFYATGGGGWGHGKITGTSLGVTVSGDAWHSGWSGGGGIEWAIKPDWSTKVEYIHYGFGSASYFGVANSGKIDVDTVKIGINYLFR